MPELNQNQNQQPEQGSESAEGQQQNQQPDQQPDQQSENSASHQDENTDWKAHAREWEKKAKANKAAADELAQLKQSQMTEDERAAEKLRLAEESAAEATAKAARLELAVTHGLSKEDADLLEGITDIEAMERVAQRLASLAQQESGPRTPRPNPNQGSGAQSRPSTADLFASTIGQHFNR